jgi:hypothetical protein
MSPANKVLASLALQLDANTAELKKDLAAARSDLQKYGKDVESIGTSVKNSWAKVAGGFALVTAGLAAAKGVLNTFKDVIGSTQFSADAFEKTMAGAKQGVDSFFIAISSGDWDNFWEGLRKSVNASRELAETMDALGDIRRGYSVKEAQLQGIQDELLVKMRDKTGKYTLDQQKAFYAEYVKNQEDFNAKILAAEYREQDAILKRMEAITGMDKAELITVMTKYGDTYEREFNNVVKRIEAARVAYSKTNDAKAQVWNEDAYINSLTGVEGMMAKLYREYGKLNDTELDTLAASLVKVWEAVNKNTSDAVENLRVYNSLSKGTGVNAAANTTDINPYHFDNADYGSQIENDILNNFGTATPTAIDPKIINRIHKQTDAILEQREQARRLADTYAMMGDMLNNALNQGANSWEEYGAQVKDAIANMILASTAMIITNSILSAMNTAKAAGPLGLIILPGLIALGLGIAKTAINQIPGFAEGGIVPGGSYTGDQVPAYVNSGEMILNRSQQATLFNMANENGGSWETANVTIGFDSLQVALQRINKRNRII